MTMDSVKVASVAFEARRTCSGRAACRLKVKNPAAPAVTREAEEEWELTSKCARFCVTCKRHPIKISVLAR